MSERTSSLPPKPPPQSTKHEGMNGRKRQREVSKSPSKLGDINARKRQREPSKSPPKSENANSRKRQREPSEPPSRSEGNDSKRQREPSRSPPRERKRPGAASRLTTAEKEAQQQRQRQREREQAEALEQVAATRGSHNVVTQHYNHVIQRGREWRATESKIKNLRSYNNWAKSTLIQKFSPNESFDPRMGRQPGIKVLDIGCGKGGDLQKWQNAPQRVDQYVGIDPAEVSIEQAKGRYSDMRRRRGRGGPMFMADFFVKDGYGESLNDIPLIRDIGFDPEAGPEAATRWSPAGFDVVSMMFCMHYAFESEGKARGMLSNVAGALKKGGRFIGVIPNSDVLRGRIKSFYGNRKLDVDGEKEKDNNESRDEERDEKTKSKDESAKKIADKVEVAGEIVAPEWGNGLYRVRFPGKAPEDGIFRPPFGWKYSYFLEEAVEEVPEYIVPWEAFRALAEDFNLELQYRKPLADIWEEERNDPELGRLSERMKVTDRPGGELKLTAEEVEAVGFYHAFCFYKV